MRTFTSPPPAIDLSTPLYYQLVHTLIDLLPPPLDDTPEALRARNHAAIAKVAALLPVNANEADLAAQCIAARAQAEDILRLLRQHTGDILLVMRLNAQYSSMVRTSLSAHARLMRVQAVRHKREATDDAANQDAWTLHIAERSMLKVLDPDAEPPQATSPEGIHPEWLAATPIEAQPACMNQKTTENVSDTGTNSHNTAFETQMSAIHWNGMPKTSGKTGPSDIVHELLARSRLAAQESPTTGRETLGSANDGAHFDGKCPNIPL